MTSYSGRQRAKEKRLPASGYGRDLSDDVDPSQDECRKFTEQGEKCANRMTPVQAGTRD
jgi:hypothetical protein